MFRVDDVPAGSDFPVLKKGVYEALVEGAEWGESRTGTQSLKVHLLVHHRGRKHHVWQDFYHTRADDSAIDMGRRHIAALAKACAAVGSDGMPDPALMPGNAVTASVDVEEYDGRERNVVKGFKVPADAKPASEPAPVGGHRYGQEPVKDDPLDDDIPF